jgi:hypothetical protein
MRSESVHAHWPIVLKHDRQAATENLRGDDVGRSVRVNPCTAVEQICRSLLGVEHDDRLSGCIDVEHVA